MTPDEVACVLRTSRAAVYKMQERGQSPGVRRIGRRLLFDRLTLLDWMGQNPTSSLNRAPVMSVAVRPYRRGGFEVDIQWAITGWPTSS